MTVSELAHRLNTAIPASLSCEWDHDGLMCCPEPEREVKKLLLVLDITEKAIEFAKENAFDVILSHHPLIFRPVAALEPSKPVSRKLITLIQCGIAALSFHTRFDALFGGVNDVLASLLGLSSIESFGPEGEEMGRIGICEPCTLPDFAQMVKSTLGTPMVLCCGNREVHRVAVLGGGGDDFIEAAIAAGADTYLSGRLGYHSLAEAVERGINLVEAGHFYTEAPSLIALEGIVRSIAPDIECVRKAETDIFAV